MSAKKIMSNADIIRLLELYRLEFNNEVPKSQDQLEALKRIAKAMNIPGLGPKQIAVKFNNLKKVYLQELKKVEASKASGADALSVYVPSLYWFPTMQAILSSGTLNQASSTFIPEEDDHSLGDLGSMNKNDNDGNSDSQDGQLDDGTGKNASFHVRGGKTSPIPVEQSAQESMELKLPDMPDRPGGVMADTLDHFGKYVASILRELPYDRSYNLQQKFINEAIAARLVYEEQHPTEFPEKDKDHETQAPSVTQEADPISKITANPEDKTSPVDSPAGKHRKRRKKSHSPIPTSSSDTVTSMAIKEEVPDNIEETENPDLPMSEQDNSRTDDSYSYMEIGEEMKLEYNGSSFETVYCESETSQMRKEDLDPKPKPERKKWNTADMVLAIKAVRNKEMGLKKASQTFSIPRTSLQRLVRVDKPPEEAAATRLGRKTIMADKLERELVEYLLLMESKFDGLTRQDVCRIAYVFCERNRIKNPFSREGLAGRAWCDHFVMRHKDVLSVLKPAPSSCSRANRLNKETINNFFDILETEFGKHNYPADPE